MDAMRPVFHWADYLIFVLMLLASASIGIFYAFMSRRQNSSGEFMLASRTMGFLPVSMSLLASLFTGIYIQGSVSETYFRGAILFTGSIVPLIITGAISGRIFMPKFYELELKSVYQYLDLRFNVPVRNCCLVIGYVYMILHAGVATFAASLVLTTVTGSQLSVFSGTIILSAVCTFYTVIGGIKAVVWADCFQMCLIFVALLAAVFQGATLIGFGEIWRLNLVGGRLNIFNFDPDPRVYATFWTVFIGGTFSWMPTMTVLQYQVQRYATCKSQKTAHIAFSIFIVGCIAVTILCILAGMSIYALYVDCDPFSTGSLVANDGLLPYYILDAFQNLPGIPGLLVSGLCSAALSTVSSILNSIATISGEHIVSKVWRDMSDARYLMITRLLALVFGALNIATAMLVGQLGNILPAIIGLVGITNGPVCAVFILGFFFRRANSKGTLVGFLVGAAVGIWLFVGSLFYQPLPMSLPLSTEGCEDYEFAADGASISSMMTTMMAMASTIVEPPARPFIIELYNVSRLWYPMVCMILVVVVGLVASLIFEAIYGEQEVDATLLWNWRKSCCCCLKTSQTDDRKSLYSRNISVLTTLGETENSKYDESKGIDNPVMGDGPTSTTHM
ncbi:sodium-coupled monocarboxylate transporter 1-like [Asterias amurensis]|uniref:sodium-coupled monocarboxylate transporter 1-like n=1 Tax=Asterias amurensis TaxID=7602 RepID=UPI003AB18371